MKTVENFPRKVIEQEDCRITMRDGTRLSARIWMPEDASENPVPIILEHLPYRKRDGTIVRDQYTHPWMAGHGYCCIRTDMRGSGESEGLLDDEYTTQELQDAIDVIEWACAQPWCNGSAGMMGISWGGFNCLQVAALAPPALKAVISICSTVDRFADDIHFKGGCLLVENFGWAANMLSYSSRPPDPALVGDEAWLDIWRHRLENQPWHWTDWHCHQHRDAYWQHGSVCEDYSAIKAAVLSIGGWHDGYRNTISQLVSNIAAPVKGIVGPWNHKYPHYAGPKPAIGFLQEAKRWWDRWLKDEETGVEDDPAYRAYVMDSLAPQRWFDERPGRWISETEWPSEAIRDRTFHLGQEGLLDHEPSPFSASVGSPQTCGAMSGEYFPFAFADELPDDQRHDDAGSLCFDSSEMIEAHDIVGAPVVTVTLSSDQPSALLAVRLCDLRPDGTSTLITHGVLNLAHHQGHGDPQPLEPGVNVTATLSLDQIAYRLPKGHRLRIALSNAYWPVVWPSPLETRLTLISGNLALPVRPLAQEDECTFEAPQGAPEWRREQTRASHYRRDVSTGADGTVTVSIDADDGENRDLEHGLISGSWTKEQFSIHPNDPLSATAKAEWEQTGGRPGQMWRTHVDCHMWADKEQFHSRATLSTFLEGEPFFERTFEESVPRDLV